jgi:prepilin-type N-terminal cleavage/methylation domain-containing protein
MKYGPLSKSGQAGVSLVETLVVIVIISIVAALALMQRGSANEQLRRQNVARELKVAFERARFDSVKRHPVSGGPILPSYVTVTPSSYTLRTYNNGVANDQVATLPAGIAIERYDGTPLTSFDVIFNMRGETGTSPPPQFYVCNDVPCSHTNARANLVIVTPTGTVNLLPGGGTLPVFGNPVVTNVAGTANINPDVIVP